MTNDERNTVASAIKILEQKEGFEGPGDVIMDQMYKLVVTKYIVPLMMKRFQDLPGLATQETVDQKKWEEWVLKQIKDSQSN